MKTIQLLEQLAVDVKADIHALSSEEITRIETLKREAAEMNPLMAIVEPSDPDHPSPEPDEGPWH